MNLEQAFRQTLADLEMTSCGTTSSWNSSGNGKKGSREPVTGDGEPPHLRYRRLWVERPFRRSELLEEAQAELKALRKSPPAPASPKDDAEKLRAERWADVVVYGTGVPAARLATRLQMGRREVENLRKAAGQTPDEGSEVESGAGLPRSQRASLLASQGFTTREIGSMLGFSHTTIRGDLAA